jgi:hypothetical protein
LELKRIIDGIELLMVFSNKFYSRKKKILESVLISVCKSVFEGFGECAHNFEVVGSGRGKKK